MIFYGEQLY